MGLHFHGWRGEFYGFGALQDIAVPRSIISPWPIWFFPLEDRFRSSADAGFNS